MSDEIVVFEGLRVFRGRIYKKDRRLAMLWFFAMRDWVRGKAGGFLGV